MILLQTLTPWLGWISGAVLVLGAAWPEKKKESGNFLKGWMIAFASRAWPKKTEENPLKSAKNWIFVLGTLGLLLYSIFNYLLGGSILYVFLEGLAGVASVLMMFNLNDRTDSLILGPLALLLVVSSWIAGEGLSTMIFILGLMGIGLGYTFTPNTLRRQGALLVGSILVALFSYWQNNPVFLWLNIFFAIFSLYYFLKQLNKVLILKKLW